MTDLPAPFTLTNLRAAQALVASHIAPTPLVRSPWGPWLKLEIMQPTGSFKVRPAFYGMLSRLGEARTSGVIASSSGNFAQAVAHAARELGVNALIVMTSGTSPFKIDRTRALGARVEICGDSFEERWETTYRLQKESGRLLLHPYDSDETLLGDATAGAEIADSLPVPAQGADEGDVIVPSSGGGLLSGITVAMKLLRPGWRVWGVQTEANGSLVHSLAAGNRVKSAPFKTVADALVAAMPGKKTFELIRAHSAGAVTVNEEQTRAAVLRLVRELHLVVEPGGATPLAAWTAAKIPGADPNRLVLVLSGGNIPLSTLAAWEAGA